ncbi:MAG: alpha/beta fold hydrolase [Burkholderiales bacterium]|nr:alpha/beta fold hydrolase [Burkholderiales bacterium]
MVSLVLLPGLASDHRMWRHQLEALHDLQPQVSDVHMRCDSIEAMAAALLAETPGDLALCGASMGGMIAMEAVRQAPQRVRALALLGTNARPEDDAMRKLREDAIVLFGQGRLRDVIEPNIAFAFHPANATALAGAYLDFVLDAGAEQLIRQNRAVIVRPDARVHLGGVRCPTLVMCGDADQLTPSVCSQEIASLVAGARFVQVPQCGHMLTMEQPDAVNREVRQWFASLAA